MTRQVLVAVAALAAGVAAAAALEVDFTKDVGKIRPELHSSGFGPTICSQTAQDLADLEPQSVPFKDGVLTLEKRDGNDAAFLVTFE